MKPINNFEKVQGYTNGSMQLPVGGYVVKITGVRYENGHNGGSDRIVVAFDVAEGEHAGFFKKRFDSDQNEDRKWKGTTVLYVPKEDGSEQDEWTIRRLKTFTNALEDSNQNYHWDWDENKWKGLLVGGVFGEVHTVIDGKQIQYTTFRNACSVEDIRKGNFKIPKVQLKNGASASVAKPADPMKEEFMQIPEGSEEEVPF